jgi:tetratricopeptide (TPR) repeat protein
MHKVVTTFFITFAATKDKKSMTSSLKSTYFLGFFLWMICLMVSCAGGQVYERLLTIEQELDNLHYVEDSLYHEVDSIVALPHLSDKEQALAEIILFRMQLINHTKMDGSLPDHALEYYEHYHDPRMLAWCYNTKAIYLMQNSKQYDEIIKLLKKAEEIASPLDEPKLKCDIYQSLELANLRALNYEKEFQYSQKVLDYCQQLQDTALMVLSYNNHATAYAHMAEVTRNKALLDSAKLSCRRCIPLMDYLENKAPAKPYIFATIGGTYLDEHRVDSALYFAEQSMAVRPTYYGYLLLSKIAEEQGDMARADSLFKQSLTLEEKSLNVVSANGKAVPLSFYYQFKLRQGQYREACQLMEQIVATKDSLNQAHRVQQINELQTKYDQEVKRRALDKKLYRYSVITAVLLVLIMAMIALWRYRSLKAKAERLRLQGQLSEYRRQVLELESHGEGNSRTIELLNAKIGELQQGLHDMLYHGKEKYEEIMAGGNTVKWDKQDFEDFLNYYRLIDLPYITEMEAKYENLSPRNLFYLVLERLGKSNEEIQNILCIGASSLRTLRSRLRKQLKPTTPQEREN